MFPPVASLRRLIRKSLFASTILLASGASAAEWNGITADLTLANEYLGVVKGGFRPGGEFNGLIQLGLGFDLEKLVSWKGATFYVSGLYAYGESLSGLHIGDESNVSNINARNSPRFFEVYLEQKFGDKFSLRIGQITTDTDFYGTGNEATESEGGGLFLNSDFGAAPIMSFNVPEPIFPVAAPGIQLTFTPTEQVTVRAAVFDGDPEPDVLTGTQLSEHGLEYHLQASDGLLFIAETAVSWDLGSSRKLGGLATLGGFYHTNEFTRWNDGSEVHGNYGGYLLANQMLWRENDEDHQGLSVFARFGLAPEDRSVLNCTVDGGIVYRGLIPGRNDDVCGFGVSCKKYSKDFSKAEQAEGNASRDHETIFEFSYRAQITDWCFLQPDAQYVMNPAGDHGASDAIVIGARLVLEF